MPDATQIDLAPVRVGEILAGKYEALRVLGAGGMGVVVAARHIHLDQKVALKFLLPESLAKPKVVARFEREARAVVKLKGEHVARVLDVGKMDTGAPYIVMEFLEGMDLAHLLEKNGRLPIDEAADYVLQACEALAEAHALRIVHRDLKPGNLFLTRRVDGRQHVKVLDFGISKLEGVEENLSLTQTSEVVGSPKYMAPEQLRGAKFADARSDIWSLGIILYELITANVPFDAETLAHLCAVVISDPPRPVRELLPDVPSGIEAIILRCLDKDPAKRFQNVADFARALEPFAMSHDRSAADRILAVASSGSFPQSAASSQNIVVAHGNNSTSVGWGQTELQKPGGRGKWIIAGTAAAFVVVGIGVAMFEVGARGHAVGDPQSSASSPASSASSPILATSEIAPATTSSTTPVTSASVPSASASSTTIAKPPASTRATPHPHKPPKPAQQSNGLDDMPNERN